jgi:hypothetical protein
VAAANRVITLRFQGRSVELPVASARRLVVLLLLAPAEPAREVARLIDDAIIGELPLGIELTAPQRAVVMDILALPAIRTDSRLRRLWDELRET